FVSVAGSDGQRERWLRALASAEKRGASAFEPGEGNLVLDPAGADVLVLPDGGHGARLVDAADAEIETVEMIDATRGYGRASVSAGDSLPGDAEAAADRAVVAL